MTTTKNKETFIRALSPSEQFTDACTVHRNLFMVGALEISTTKRMTMEDLRSAAKALQKQHLQLQAKIKHPASETEPHWLIPGWSTKKKLSPGFWTHSNPEEALSVQWVKLGGKVGDDSWRKIVMEAYLQVTFDPEGLLWRCIFIDLPSPSLKEFRGVLLLNAHPSIADLRGIYLLLDDLMGHLDGVLKQGSGERVAQVDRAGSEKTIMHPAELHPDYASQGFGMSDALFIAKFMASMLFSPFRNIYLSSHPIPPVSDFATRSMKLSITDDVSNGVLRKIREHGVSLHSLVTVVAGAAMHKMMDVDSTSVVTLMTTHECNLRDYCAPELLKDKDRLHGGWCNYIEEPMQAKSFQKLNVKEIWKSCAEVESTIVAKKKSDFPAKMSCIFSKMGSPYDFFDGYATNRTSRNYFAVAVDDDLDDLFRERENIKILEVTGCIASHCMASPFMNRVNVFNGKMTYVLMYFGNFVTRAQAEDYAKNVLDVLKLVASS